MGENLNGGATENLVKRTAAQTAVLMAILTLVSKLLGFVREMVMANFFGTSYVADAYVMAQNIPNMLFAGILSAVSTSFMPLFSEKTEKEGIESGNKFVNEVLNMLMKVSTIITIFGVVFAPQFVAVFAPGFEGERATLTIFFLRITFLYITFNSANTLLKAFLQYRGVFLPPIAYGYAQNFIVIAFIIAAALTDERIMVFGLLISYILINILLTRLANKHSFKRQYSLKNSGVAKQIVALSLPVFIGGYVAQINTYVDKALASNLPEGSVAALNYALLIISLVTGLTVTIISTIVFPRLNQAKALGNQDQYNMLLSKSFNLTAIISVPFGLGAMAFSNEVVQVIYERGAFDEAATALTGIALFWYGPHLIVSSLNTTVTRAFYSNKDMKTPMYIGIVVVLVNVTMNLLLVRIMGLGGLAFATSIAGTVGLILRSAMLKRRFPEIQLIESPIKLLKIFISALIAVGAGFALNEFLVTNIWMPRMIYLGISVILACVIYLLILWITKVEELNMIKLIFNRKRQ